MKKFAKKFFSPKGKPSILQLIGPLKLKAFRNPLKLPLRNNQSASLRSKPQKTMERCHNGKHKVWLSEQVLSKQKEHQYQSKKRMQSNPSKTTQWFNATIAVENSTKRQQPGT